MIYERFFAAALLLPRRWRATMDAALSHYGLTSATCRPLFYLGRLGEGVRPKDLAEFLEIERPSLAQLLDRLEAAGLVRRQEDPHDRRGKTLHFTPEGRRIYDLTTGIADRMAERLFADVHEQDIEACERVFARIFANIERELEAAAPAAHGHERAMQ
ncbi:MarR family transcriptional regulator [Rhodoblastus sp.]|jgi:MarR family transcriptional regulator for hemolysin|uniref:MarR family winged helix-turn-helix transcriptional regulator n=1 Tax=Rhodoblastus sp. TaxID=1962975 RepID=UPI002605DD2C|nr:MarR family transcriptional regulator [Rhodoblastus sp.]